MSYFSFFYIGSDALPHLSMPPGYHFSRKSTAAESFSILHQNAAALHITLLHQNHINTVLYITLCSLYCFVYPLFSFIFLIFLSIFIHFYLFFYIFLFYTSRVASIFTPFFCFCERGSGGVWSAGETWARQRGVWPANCVHGVGNGRIGAVQGRCSCTPQCAPHNVVAALNLPAKLRFVFFS